MNDINLDEGPFLLKYDGQTGKVAITVKSTGTLHTGNDSYTMVFGLETIKALSLLLHNFFIEFTRQWMPNLYMRKK